MNAIDFLTAPGVAPFTGALLVVLAAFLVEVVLTLLAGAGFGDLLDALVGVDSLPDGSFTNWLLVKEVPLLMVALTFFGGFGLTGLASQAVAASSTGVVLPAAAAYVAAVIGGFLSVRTLGYVFSKFRVIHTTALKPEEFIGRVASLKSPNVYRGYSGEASFVDQYGFTHYVMVEPELDDIVFHQGDQIVLVRKASVALYHARKA